MESASTWLTSCARTSFTHRNLRNVGGTSGAESERQHDSTTARSEVPPTFRTYRTHDRRNARLVPTEGVMPHTKSWLEQPQCVLNFVYKVSQ